MTVYESATLVALVTGPLVAVLITLWHQDRAQKRGEKQRLFMTLMAHRKSVPPTFDWANALNLIDVVYADNLSVVHLWHDLYDILGRNPINWQEWNHKYLELLFEMAKTLSGGFKFLTQQAGYKTPRWGCANSAPCAGGYS